MLEQERQTKKVILTLPSHVNIVDVNKYPKGQDPNTSCVLINENCILSNKICVISPAASIHQHLDSPDPLQVCISPNYLALQVMSYRAGNISSALTKRQTLTSDRTIISIIKHGLTLRLDSPPPGNTPNQYKLNKTDTKLVDQEIQSLLHKGVIVPTVEEENDHFSPIFLRLNKDGSTRLLLNLKAMNEHIEPIHFKMETFSCVLQILTPNCWLASVDLKSAYYSVPIRHDHQKYSKFYWDQPYKFVALPNGLLMAPGYLRNC